MLFAEGCRGDLYHAGLATSSTTVVHGGRAVSSNGFLATRRGLLEHLRDGRLTLREKGAFQTICELAHWKTGVWWGSARALAAICGAGDITERQARKILESLEKAGYIRRFATPGIRASYGIVVDKYEVRVGKLLYRVNAKATQDCEHPVLELCQVRGKVRSEVRGEVGASLKEVTSKTGPGRKTNPSASASPQQAESATPDPPLEEKSKAESKPPANPALAESREYAYRDFERIHAQPPTWDDTDYVALAKLFRNKPKLSSLEFHRRWLNFSFSTEPFETKQAMRLRYFCANFDKFIEGPLLARPAGGGGNGRQNHAEQRTSQNVANIQRGINRVCGVRGEVAGNPGGGVRPEREH